MYHGIAYAQEHWYERHSQLIDPIDVLSELLCILQANYYSHRTMQVFLQCYMHCMDGMHQLRYL